MLQYISSLSGQRDCFVLLEKTLWKYVHVLVPAVMSFVDWAKALQSLRDANAEAARTPGSGTDDPMDLMRRFLTTGDTLAAKEQ